MPGMTLCSRLAMTALGSGVWLREAKYPKMLTTSKHTTLAFQMLFCWQLTMLFFGDRHTLFQPNQGGAAYRNLKYIVVPLPFKINCSSLRLAVERRRSKRPPRFRVSFVGSVNGASRNLIRAAVVGMQASLTAEEQRLLAIRFVLDDGERSRLSQEPGAVLGEWFGGGLASFDQLLRESQYCLTLPGDVSDVAMRFLHALSVGCTPVVVGGPSQTIPLPFMEFIPYKRFALFATVHDVSDATSLLRSLLSNDREGRVRAPPRLEDIGGLFMHHSDCGFASGEPFLALLSRALEVRARVWSNMRWFN